MNLMKTKTTFGSDISKYNNIQKNHKNLKYHDNKIRKKIKYLYDF